MKLKSENQNPNFRETIESLIRRKTIDNFRRLDDASQNEDFMLTNAHRSKRSARYSMLRKSRELTHPISVIEFCIFLRYSFLFSTWAIF